MFRCRRSFQRSFGVMWLRWPDASSSTPSRAANSPPRCAQFRLVTRRHTGPGAAINMILVAPALDGLGGGADLLGDLCRWLAISDQIEHLEPGLVWVTLRHDDSFISAQDATMPNARSGPQTTSITQRSMPLIRPPQAEQTVRAGLGSVHTSARPYNSALVDPTTVPRLPTGSRCDRVHGPSALDRPVLPLLGYFSPLSEQAAASQRVE